MNTISRPILLAAIAFGGSVDAATLHVATTGDDANPGSDVAPFRSIQRAATAAMPGDTIAVRAGTYRERINPPRGGESEEKRIIYQAHGDGKVEIKGSEVIKTWTKVGEDIWKAELPNSMFGDFNPYSDLIRGDWFNPKGRDHHTGTVYLNGEWLIEAATLADVLKPTAGEALWFGAVDAEKTTIHARFKGVDPNRELVEINVRRTVFYPDQPGRNFITVRGFTMCHAATPWAPPTAEQIGLIGTHWSKGWIIENNVVSHSICSGIALGKHGDQFDNTSANSAEGYVKTIERAHAHAIPWTKDNIGHHIVRSNVVFHCEQAGIVGSLGGAFSTITGNHIHDIHIRRLFTGAEMAGIKLHAAIDTLIANNHIHHTNRGLWLDWMAQGTRVSANLFHANASEDVFMEVNHGPYLLDNNISLSTNSILDMSQGGAFVHNLFAGKIISQPERSRATPYHPAHSTAVAGIVIIEGGDNRFFNNLFIGDGSQGGDTIKAAAARSPRGAGFGLRAYDVREAPLLTSGNVFLHGAQPWEKETGAVIEPDLNPYLTLTDAGGTFTLRLKPGANLRKTAPVTTATLGKARISSLPYQNPDGTPVRIDHDFLGEARDNDHPAAGPFEKSADGTNEFVVWRGNAP